MGKRIKYSLAIASMLIYFLLSSSLVHAAAKPLGQFHGGDNIDLGVYIKTTKNKFYSWTNCGDHDMMPPDDDNRYPVTYDQYDFYEGLAQYKTRGTQPNRLYNNRDYLVASWFAMSEDSDVLMDYYRDFYNDKQTPNDVAASSYKTFKASDKYFANANGTMENFRYNSAQDITWYYSNGYRLGTWYTSTPFNKKAFDFSQKYPVSEETARALHVALVDSNGKVINEQNPLKVDATTLLTTSFTLTGYDYPVRADLTNMPYTIVDASGTELPNKASSNEQKAGKVYNYILSNQEYRVKIKAGTSLEKIPNLNLSYLRMVDAYYYLPVSYSDGDYRKFQHMLGWKIEKVDLSIPFKVEVKETQVEGEKKWQDYNNKFNTRPDKITINLLKDGQVYKQQEVSKETNWKYQFDHLPLGPTYTITEEPVTGYTPTIVGNDITNTYVNTEKVEKPVQKIWQDQDDHYGTRPSQITFVLYQNGTKLASQTVKPDASGNWTYTFKDLPKYDENGDEYTYTVKEDVVPGYDTTIQENGTTSIVTNKLKVTTITGQKKWDDLDNKYGLRPDSITVNLYRNDQNEVFQTQVVSANTNWQYQFKDLPLQDKNGKTYTYTVKEVAVPGYDSTLDGTTITNKLKVTQIQGEKKWDDQNNVANLRPEAIVVELLRDGVKIEEQKVTPDQNGKWTYAFNNLLVEDQSGKLYKYTVKEQAVTYYTATISGTTITNTLKLTNIEGKKQWLDNDNAYGMRPDKIVVWLVRNGQRIEKQEVTAGSNNDWTFSFKHLPVNDEKGAAYAYTLEEEPVENYTTAIDGTTIINTFKPQGVLPETGGRYKQSMIYAGLAIVIVGIISGIVYFIKNKREY